jgi:hypothetical protein
MSRIGSGRRMLAPLAVAGSLAVSLVAGAGFAGAHAATPSCKLMQEQKGCRLADPFHYLGGHPGALYYGIGQIDYVPPVARFELEIDDIPCHSGSGKISGVIGATFPKFAVVGKTYHVYNPDNDHTAVHATVTLISAKKAKFTASPGNGVYCQGTAHATLTRAPRSRQGII